MKWIKASERLPEEKHHSDIGGLLFLKVYDVNGAYPTLGYYSDGSIPDGWYNISDKKMDYENEDTEWLDETDGWISVEDRLPEVRISKSEWKYRQSDWVLAATDKGILTEMALWDGENWFTSCDAHPEERITHWQKLPAPPTI